MEKTLINVLINRSLKICENAVKEMVLRVNEYNIWYIGHVVFLWLHN